VGRYVFSLQCRPPPNRVAPLSLHEGICRMCSLQDVFSLQCRPLPNRVAPLSLYESICRMCSLRLECVLSPEPPSPK
jgi:hypothetical protein